MTNEKQQECHRDVNFARKAIKESYALQILDMDNLRGSVQFFRTGIGDAGIALVRPGEKTD